MEFQEQTRISRAHAVTPAAGEPSGVAWFCVRTQPKHEHIAAAQLRLDPEIEVFLPRIRYQRRTRTGPAWVTEALFVNYLFARFNLASALRRVQSGRAVRDVVHFGDRWPTVPESAINELKSAIGLEEVKTIARDLQPGDIVEIAGGIFSGLQAVVTRAMPGQQRAGVLLEFLGRQAAVELDRSQLIGERVVCI